MRKWKMIDSAPEDQVVMTKIDDAKGERNVQALRKRGNLWWTSDGAIYVYYRPTHWMALSEELGSGASATPAAAFVPSGSSRSDDMPAAILRAIDSCGGAKQATDTDEWYRGYTEALNAAEREVTGLFDRIAASPRELGNSDAVRREAAQTDAERARADHNWNVADYFSGLLDQHGISHEWPGLAVLERYQGGKGARPAAKSGAA